MTSYQSLANINIYESPNFTTLATQMAKGRFLRILQPEILRVQLLEDGYTGFIRNLFQLKPLPAELEGYSDQPLSEAEIRNRISGAIAYIKSAMNVKNEYLWGGTVPPNFDCSGIIQAAFCAQAIWLPRDAYQQEEFATSVSQAELEAGDLIFFGVGEKANHVGMYLGEGKYIHSSGKEKGRNGIGIDFVNESAYSSEVRSFGRITRSLTLNNLNTDTAKL
jgi:cell wall-associated NlpC family hydrolase